MNWKKKRHSITAFLLAFVLCFQIILPVCNPPIFAATTYVSDEFSMDANSFTIDGVAITKAEFIKALSGAKRVPTEWQNKKIRIASATAEYANSPAFDEKSQTALGTLGIGVANVFAKISFALTMVDIAGTYWYFEINGLPMDVFATNAGFVINGISLGFNWLTYELSQYLSNHMNDWYDASELTDAGSEATGESTATEEGSEAAEEESETKEKYEVSDSRREHILEGDPPGTGHGPNRGDNEGAFPDTWTDDQAINAIEDVANSPNSTWQQATGSGYTTAPVTQGGPDPNAPLTTSSGSPVRFKVQGQDHGLTIEVIVEPGGEGIITGYVK